MKTNTNLSKKAQQKPVPVTPSESGLRKKARRLGYKITKLRERSSWFGEFGPFMVTDLTNNVAVNFGMGLDDVSDWLSEEVDIAATPGGKSK